MFDTSHIQTNEYIDGDAFENLQIAGVTYSKADEVKPLLETGTVNGILVTHNSDLGIDKELVSLAFDHNPNLFMWFGQNIKIKHPSLVPIPIGLERVRWVPHLGKRGRLHTFAERSLEVPIKLCLANFSISTNTPERQACLEAVSAFATLRTAKTVCQDPPDSYNRYLTEILEHKFVLCPEGNGVDTHRLWETLYLGRIPVVIRSELTDTCRSLPMVVLDSWRDLSCKQLLDYWNDFCEGRIPYNLNRLVMSFWRNQILSASHVATFWS